MDFSKFNTTPPAPPAEGETTNTEEQTPEVEQPQATETQPEVTEQAQTEKPDEFFEGFNKRYGTQYKSDDEIKGLFELPGKVTEQEARLREKENLEQSIVAYKQKIEELEGDVDPLKYFSSPQAYVAEQLRMQNPKLNGEMLYRLATTNLEDMDDLDVLMNEKLLFVPKLAKEGNLRGALLKRYGFDPTVDLKEQGDVDRTELIIDAASARDKIKGFIEKVQPPTVVSKEEKQRLMAEAATQREQSLVPHRNNFTKFDKLTLDGVVEYDVPDEFKKKLPDIFNGFFKDASAEVTEENINYLMELRNMMCVWQYLPQLKEIFAKEGETRATMKNDAQQHNDTPPNTTTATDHQDVKTVAGLKDLFSELRR